MSLLNKNAAPAEVLRGCFFSEKFQTSTTVGLNGGTLVGSPTINNGYDATAATGKSITYRRLSGEGKAKGGGLTLSFKLKIAHADFDGTLASVFDNCSHSPNNGGFYLVLDDRGGGNPTNGLNFGLGTGTGGTSRAFVVSNVIDNNIENHYVISYDGVSTCVVYKNGVAFATTASGSGSGFNPSPATNTTFRIGARSSDGALTIKGTLKDCRVWAGTLTAQEALDLYNNATFTYKDKNIIDLPMTMDTYDFTNKLVLDKSGRGNNFTLGNGSTSSTYPTKLPTQGFSIDGGDYLKRTVSGISNTSGTLSLCFKTDVLTTQIGMLLGETTSKNNVYFVWDSKESGRVTMYNSSSGATNVFTSVMTGTNTMTISIAWNATTIFYCANKQFIAAVSRPANVDLSAATNIFLGFSGTSFYVTGKLYSFKLNSLMLTPTQCLDLHLKMLSEINTI